MELHELITDLADALYNVDQQGPQEKYKDGYFKPGIGPFNEDNQRNIALNWLIESNKPQYRNLTIEDCTDINYPNGLGGLCDLVIPDKWAVELKLLRPFGNVGREDEHWIKKIIYPYYGHKSLLGDALKLEGSRFVERKAVILFAYDHEKPRIDVEPALRCFELILSDIYNIQFTPRIFEIRAGLVHPVHQVLRVIGWEISEKER